jgi:uncharacterized protein (TIGR02145 family)
MKTKVLLAFLVSFLFLEIQGQTVTDSDGNIYTTIPIGKQVWFAENLKTTKFNDGSTITLIKDQFAWKNNKKPAYCWFNNDISNKDNYGALYNFHVVETGKICPKEWRVPSDADWNILISELGPEEMAGDKLKERGTIHWKGSYGTATDEYGFTALPAGFRLTEGVFPVFGSSYAIWWSSTGRDSHAWTRGVFFSTSKIYSGFEYMNSGYSIRCMKDR